MIGQRGLAHSWIIAGAIVAAGGMVGGALYLGLRSGGSPAPVAASPAPMSPEASESSAPADEAAPFFSMPEDSALYFYEAWFDGDRDRALHAATVHAVDDLFNTGTPSEVIPSADTEKLRIYACNPMEFVPRFNCGFEENTAFTVSLARDARVGWRVMRLRWLP